MPLVIFDIDGTLTDTTGVDDECFFRAVRTCLGVGEINTDWSAYPHATDTGLSREISRRHAGRELSDPAMLELRRAFVALLREQAAQAPHRFSPVPGAPGLLAHLASLAGWKVAVATGAWRDSAMVKLQTSRVGAEALPMGTSDDDEDRANIVRIAAARAMNADPHQALSLARERLGSVVYVGDGVWDARTSRALGIGFVGVRVRGDFDRLVAQGASHLCRDFVDPSAVVDLIGRAGEGSWR